MPHENVASWKDKAEIDYFPLFFSLWLSFNAWMRNELGKQPHDKQLIERLIATDRKSTEGKLKDEFMGLMTSADANGNTFRGHFAELHKALANAGFCRRGEARQETNSYISFENCYVGKDASGESIFASIIKKEKQREKIRLEENLFIDSDGERVFAGYIMTLYEIRCFLFHGDMMPTKKNGRVIMYFYLTLSMVMQGV